MASTQELFNDQRVLLNEVLQTLKVMKLEHQQLSTTVNTINGRVNMLAGVKTVQDIAGSNNRTVDHGRNADRSRRSEQDPGVFTATTEIPASPSLPVVASSNHNGQQSGSNPSTAKGSPSTSRIILTTYPGQSGIDPLVMNWGHKDATQRGPVVVSRSQSTIRRRNGRPTTYCLSTCMLTYMFLQQLALMEAPIPSTTHSLLLVRISMSITGLTSPIQNQLQILDRFLNGLMLRKLFLWIHWAILPHGYSKMLSLARMLTLDRLLPLRGLIWSLLNSNRASKQVVLCRMAEYA